MQTMQYVQNLVKPVPLVRPASDSGALALCCQACRQNSDRFAVFVIAPVRPLLPPESRQVPEKPNTTRARDRAGISFPQLICYLDLAPGNTAVMILVAGAISGFKLSWYRFASGATRAQMVYPHGGQFG
jgi:hypothetical protein